MRVTFIGHAGLFIESGDSTMLVDPWLSGSCYWRSWWHYPPSPEPDDRWLEPRYLYLTHHHFDHFHYPSLRRISRGVRVLIPYFGNDVMPRELVGLGFRDIIEMHHAEPTALGDGLVATSFQYGFDDSTLVVSDPDATLFDLNDCKIRPAALKKLRRHFGSPDLMVKSHSWAQGYPNCYRAQDPADLTLLAKGDYVTDFLQSAAALEPRYAVPFASMVCFLHPDTWDRNRDVVTPTEVADAFARTPVPCTTLALVKPGDTWQHGAPFRTDVGDYYTNRSEWLDRRRREVADVIDRSLKDEHDRRLVASVTEEYFRKFVRAVPRVGALVLKHPCVLRVRDTDQYFVLDWRRRTAYATAERPLIYASMIELPGAVLSEAVERRIVHFVHISMRFQADVRRGGISTDFALWTLLGLWELGYLPMRSLLNRRFVSVCWRRRAEIRGLIAAAVRGRGSMASRMTSRFMSSEEEAGGGP